MCCLVIECWKNASNGENPTFIIYEHEMQAANESCRTLNALKETALVLVKMHT